MFTQVLNPFLIVFRALIKSVSNISPASSPAYASTSPPEGSLIQSIITDKIRPTKHKTEKHKKVTNIAEKVEAKNYMKTNY